MWASPDPEAGRSNSGTAFIAFLILGIALSWYPWFFHLAGRDNSPGPNPLGLLVAALIASAIAYGWRGPASLLVSLVRIGGPLAAWIAPIVVPVGAAGALVALAEARGIHVSIAAPEWITLAEQFLFTLLFIGLGEEPAWRGFLLPLLQKRLGPFAATLAVAAVWALWHIPLFGHEFAPAQIPQFLVSLVGGAFLLSWLYNATMSVLPCMVTHAMINTVGAGYLFRGVAKEQLVDFWWLNAAVWAAIGLLALVLTRGRFGHRDQNAD